MGFQIHSLKALFIFLTSTSLVHGLSLPPKSHSFTPGQASPGFQCSYPSGWTSCNDENNRGCWVKDPSGKQYDINTTYESEWPTGIERTFNIELTEKELSPDGYLKPLGKVMNDNYPGPLIEACWGDTITVNVKNSLPDNGTTIHWHGIRQLNTGEMDGVNGVTQCPTAPQDTFTYKFKLTQYGHTWYHSHYSLQYADGVAGPLLIHGPNSGDWDEEWNPIIMTDWLHESAFKEMHHELTAGPPTFDSILLDGQGTFPCQSSDPACVGTGSTFNRTFEAGKRYLIRLINGSAGTHFVFSIDNHIMTVVSNDLVPIKPYNTTSLNVGIGQRYSIIVEANPVNPTSDGNYWIRTEYSGCSNNIIGAPNQDSQRTGIIRYDSSSNAKPTSTRYDFTTACQDESQLHKLEPIVPWTVTEPENNITKNTYEVGVSSQPFHGFRRWNIGGTPMWLNWSDPTILDLGNTTFNPEYDVVDYDYSQGFVYMIIAADTTAALGVTHPIHLHGHDFAIIGQSTSAYDPNTSPNSFNFDNPPRRDVAMLPGGGFLAIAFKPDNPGIWLLHCHIAFHASSGLALQIMERQSEIAGSIGSLDPQRQGCSKWDQWEAENPTIWDSATMQEDSGI